MAFRKGAGMSHRLKDEQIIKLSQAEMLEFPPGLKFARDERLWMVTEAFEDGPDQIRRVSCLDSEADEVMLLNVLKKDAQADGFSFVMPDIKVEETDD